MALPMYRLTTSVPAPRQTPSHHCWPTCAKQTRRSSNFQPPETVNVVLRSANRADHQPEMSFGERFDHELVQVQAAVNWNASRLMSIGHMACDRLDERTVPPAAVLKGLAIQTDNTGAGNFSQL